MYEKVNPMHPDKVADRIAGALVDLAYKKAANPRIAVEVLLGHGVCHVIAETSEHFENSEVEAIVSRIAGEVSTDYAEVRQDPHLSDNQKDGIRCGDNGIFKGVPVTAEQKEMSSIARDLYEQFPTDGKFILANNTLVICQSCATEDALRSALKDRTEKLIINPLGEWTGGSDVDSGATNRKLGSDMADSVTGGGLHGKDLSKADVSINIYAWLKAQETGKNVEIFCAIGDDSVDGKPYNEIVECAREFITAKGGFEKFAEWGLV